MIDYRSANADTLLALRTRASARIDAIPTPWEPWNLACKGRGGEVGLAAGWHVLVAGKSGGGKTYLAANLAAHAIRCGETVAIHSLEMDWDELMTRVLGIVSGQPVWRLSPGKHFSHEHFRAAADAMTEMRGTLAINERPIGRLSEVVAGIRGRFEESGARYHVIDYLQLAWTGDAASRYDRITEVSHAVRGLAKDLGVVTIGLSQLNRDGAKGGKPQKENMDGGGPLEQDADQVVLLDHSRRRGVVDSIGRPRGWTGWAILDKNRHGPEVEIPIQYDSETGRIRERMPDEIREDEVPAESPRLRAVR